LTADLTVPFSTAVLGGEASIALRRGGKSESIQVKIPAGVESGRKMRLRGQGEPSTRGGPSGDLLLTLNVASHPHFKRAGKDLELRLPVTLGEAVFGATVDVPTPEGRISLKIPPGSSGGRRLRVKGQGIRSTTTEPGDLYVELQIKLPESMRSSETLLDESTQQAIRQVDTLYSGPVRTGIVW
jgi:DnaJ-class molecular chaperone